MSLVASGRHYIRDGTGSEQLYDMKRDPFGEGQLMGTAVGNQAMSAFRRMLLKVLTDNPGSIEVENAYLKPYKQWLNSLVHASSPPSNPWRPLNRDESNRSNC